MIPDGEWMLQSACRDLDPEAWFPASGKPEDAPAAVKVCRTCPVQSECLAYAIEFAPTAGIWAGLSSYHVRTLSKKEMA